MRWGIDYWRRVSMLQVWLYGMRWEAKSRVPRAPKSKQRIVLADLKAICQLQSEGKNLSDHDELASIALKGAFERILSPSLTSALQFPARPGRKDM